MSMVLALAPSAALATSVQPVVVDLETSGRRMSQVITVENTSQSPLPVELRVQQAEYIADGLRPVEQPSEDLLVFPAQTLIAPGRTQTFRIQYVGDPDIAQSKHYYVTVAQLPVQMPEGQTALQVLYNFQVMVGVGLASTRPALSVARAETSSEGDGQPHLVLFVENSSATYGYLAEGSLRIVQRDANGAEIFSSSMTNEEIAQQIGLGLVGPQLTRRIVTPIILPQAGGTIEAQYTPSRN